MDEQSFVVNAVPKEGNRLTVVGLGRVGEGLEDTVTGQLRGRARPHGSVRRRKIWGWNQMESETQQTGRSWWGLIRQHGDTAEESSVWDNFSLRL